MAAENIPTAAYRLSPSPRSSGLRPEPPSARSYQSRRLGRGQRCHRLLHTEDIEEAIERIMIKKAFGDSGEQLWLKISSRAKKCRYMLSAMANKLSFSRLPRTTNRSMMATKVPIRVAWASSRQCRGSPRSTSIVNTNVVQPALNGLKQQTTFTGCLYPGLMIDGDEVNVIEFNARFGDPEAEVYMRCWDSDLYEILRPATRQARSQNCRLETWLRRQRRAASPGYPGSYPKGLPITGIDEAEKLDDIVVFHAGTITKAPIGHQRRPRPQCHRHRTYP